MAATVELLEEGGFEAVELPDVARRAGVHPTTVYRRWESRARLVGEALLERARPLSPTPDTGALRTDLLRLLIEGGQLLRAPQVQALFAVLLSISTHPTPEVAQARDRFMAAHLEEIRTIIDRAADRSELPRETDPQVVMDLLIAPALMRALFGGRELGPDEAASIVDRALPALSATTRLPGASHS
jgi:AcrR family transcriptional regulator